MKVAGLLLPLALAIASLAGPLGVFRGRLVQAPPGQDRQNWVFVQSPRGMLRQVEISKAKVSYAETVPASKRAQSANTDLVPGAEVLVTADQDGAGEWRAREIQILKPPNPAGRREAYPFPIQRIFLAEHGFLAPRARVFR